MYDAEFDFARSEDKNVTNPENMRGCGKCIWRRLNETEPTKPKRRAIEQFFDQMSARIRWVEQQRSAAEPTHLQCAA